MNSKQQMLTLLFAFMIFMLLSISGCGPGQLFGPTLTPSPTATPLSASVKGKIIFSNPEALTVRTCVVTKFEDKWLIISDDSHAYRPDSEGNFKIEGLSLDSTNLCVQPPVSAFNLDPKASPLIDADGNVLEVKLTPGKITDIGEIPVLTRGQ